MAANDADEELAELITLSVDQALAADWVEGADTTAGDGPDDAIAAVGVTRTAITAAAPANLLNMPAI